MQFTINQRNGRQPRAFVFECLQESTETEEPVTYRPISNESAAKQSIFDANYFSTEPQLVSEPQSLYSVHSENNEVREWDSICWDSVPSQHVYNEHDEVLSAKCVLINMTNDHESIQETQSDIDTQFILWNAIYHQTCSVSKLLKCTQFTKEEIQCALTHLDKMKLVEASKQFGYVLSNQLFDIMYKPLLVELQRKYGEFHFDLFTIYNSNECVSASLFDEEEAMGVDLYSQIDYFGTEYEVNPSMELIIESDYLSLKHESPSNAESDFMADAFIQKQDIDDILNSFEKTQYQSSVVKKGIYYHAEDAVY